MIEIIIIIAIALLYAAASKNKKEGSLKWGVVGVIYYLIGRLLFSGFLAAGFLIFDYPIQTVNTLIDLSIVELVIGISSGITAAYILGEISGVNLNREIFK